MKRLIYVCVLLFSSFYTVHASHLMGGEITWECLPSGQYIFRMKIYRDCNGVPFGGNLSISVHNNPTLTQISMIQVQQNDVSPDCWDPALEIQCANGNSQNPVPGAVEEFLYESAPLTMSGVPPPQGWVFTYDSFARNAAINNLVNPGSRGFTLRAIMYPYSIGGVPQNANPCYDSSPQFLETPNTVICTGYPFTYNHNASDQELDLLQYAWGQPLNDFAGAWNPPANPAVIPFEPGFSHTSPLPGPTQDVRNIPATIDPATGEVSYTSFTSGNYVTVVKVEAWKCGQLVAEIYRDLQVALLACTTPNDPPAVTPPFPGGQYNITVFAGDLVNFTLNAVDFGILPNNNFQTMILEASGGQFGANFTSTTTGCINAPCATLNPAPPYSNSLNLSTVFNWQTDCNHVSYSTNCGVTSNTYNFVLKVKDDFCPAPAISIATVSVTVLPGSIDPPELKCASINANGEVVLNYLPPVINGGNFDSYEIYHSTSAAGPFNLVGTVPDYNTLSFTHTNPASPPGYYYVAARNDCGLLSTPSETLHPMHLTLTSNNSTAGISVNLSWNPISNPLPGTSTGIYEVYKEQPPGNWQQIGTTANTTFSDIITTCSATANYRIELPDASGCTSVSNVEGGTFADQSNADVIVLENVTVDPNDDAVINWQASTLSDITQYHILIDQNGSWTSVGTVNAPATTYTYVNSNAANQSERFKVISEDNCTNLSDQALVVPHNTIYLSNTFDACLGINELEWVPYDGWANGVDAYNLYLTETPPGGVPGPRTLLATLGPNTSTYTHSNLSNGHTYCYEVEATTVPDVFTSISNELCLVATNPIRPNWQYLSQVSVQNGALELEGYVDPAADVLNYHIERSDALNGLYQTIGTVPQANPAADFIHYTDFSADVKKRYFYRLMLEDPCGNKNDISENIAGNILLQAVAEGNLHTHLRWNPYEEFEGGVEGYNIYRSVDNELNMTQVAQVSGTDTSYVDDVSDYTTTTGTFCYYVEAIEGPAGGVNSYGFNRSSRSNVMCVNHKARVFIPKAFVPDSKRMVNRVFKPQGIFMKEGSYELFVLNRWGQKIFSTTDPNQGWDGSFQGKPAPMGVYMYHLKYASLEGIPIEQRDFFTLVR